MRILVTGGNGYVGRTLCRQLVADHEVCVVDTLRYGQLRFNASELQQIRFEQVDIRQLVPLRALVDEFRPDAIVHLAAIHFIPECEGKPELAVSTNVLGSANVAAVTPSGCKLVFASSGAVYRPEAEPHREHVSPEGPADVYGWTKLQGEQYVRYFAEQRRYSAIIIRLFNVIGPGETNPHVLPEIVAQLKAGRTKLQLGNLDAKRDYVHVQDVARGFAAAACSGDVPSGQTKTVNLGTQCSYSVHELLENLRAAGAPNFEVVNDPARMRPSDRPFLAANIAQINQLLNWQPQMGIGQALADLWQNPDIPQSWIDKYR